MKKFFQKTLILVFEVIVQPPKTHFLTFSSQTKIMKIAHSDPQTNAKINMVFVGREVRFFVESFEDFEQNFC